MNSPNPKKHSKSRGSEESSTDTGDRRVAELTELLKACRDLSDILNPYELYSKFAGIIKDKFGIPKLGLFVYDPDRETFELVFSYGLGKLNYKFKRGTKNLWDTILQDKPFAVVDRDVEIGEGSWIGSNVVINSGTRIGKNVKTAGDDVHLSLTQTLLKSSWSIGPSLSKTSALLFSPFPPQNKHKVRFLPELFACCSYKHIL